MLRAIVYQILDQEPDYFWYLTEIYRGSDPFAALQGSVWSIDGLMRVLERIVLNVERARPVFCVLDGLDESENQAHSSSDSLTNLLGFFDGLARRSKGFKIIVLGRSHPDIDHKLKNHNRIVMQEVNKSDVVTVVDRGISSLLTVLYSDDSSDEEATFTHSQGMRGSERTALEGIRSHLLNEADGVILWVKVCLSTLEARALEPFCSLEDLELEIHILPFKMVELYERIMIKLKESLKSPSSRALAFRAILWVRVAAESRRLRTQELSDALTIPNDVDSALRSATDPFRRAIGARSQGSLRRQLQRLCGPFVEYTQPRANSVQGESTVGKADREEQVHLAHQTAKEFLEKSPLADFLRIPPNAHEIIQDESKAYIRISFPASDSSYDPIPQPSGSPSESGITAILEYLEHKPLLSFVCNSFPELKANIPGRYRRIFQNAVNPPESDRAILQVLAEKFFFIGCGNGWATALENLFILQTIDLQDRSSSAAWYLYESSAIQAALRNCIRHELIPEVKILAWYVAERGLDLLNFPREARDNMQGDNWLATEALETGNEEIGMAVLGYSNEGEKADVLSRIRAAQLRNASTNRDRGSAAEVSRIRDAVWTVIQFWGTPPKTPPIQTQLESSEPTNSGANAYGMNVTSFGANVYGANLYGANVMAADVIDAIYPTQDNLPDEHERRRSRLSHRELSTQIPILRGGRNHANPRLPSIGESFREMEDLMQQRALANSEQSAYFRAQIEALEVEMRAQTEPRRQISEEEFAAIMNDAAWKTASSAASDKIQ